MTIEILFSYLHLKELNRYTHLNGFYEKFGWEFVEYFDPYTTPVGIQNYIG